MDASFFIRTEKAKCRVCFTCVRECPAKAIRIQEGQAEVVTSRCIGCGNCVRVCSQKAKNFISSFDEALSLIKSGAKVAACVAPSFPAAFPEYDFPEFVGLLRHLGFSHVFEVAFGADLVADRYNRLLAAAGSERYIAANCPAIVSFIEKFQPELVEKIAPIVSPMIATALAVDELYGAGIKKVFIGPCVAKKMESSEFDRAKIDVVITFNELKEHFEKIGADSLNIDPSDFDQPHPSLGTLLPISRGLLQAANIEEDLVAGEVVTSDGLNHFESAIVEFGSGSPEVRLLEILSCNGCIAGPGIDDSIPLLKKRALISKYVRYRMKSLDRVLWRQNMDQLAGLDLSRKYSADDMRMPVPDESEIKKVMQKMGKLQAADELNCGACGYDTCRAHAIAICNGLAENEMCLPYTIETIRHTASELEGSYKALEKAQQNLLQSEKMASMGQLAAGIAHEVNNPLGVVLLYANILKDKFRDGTEDFNDVAMIVEQAERCKKIVSGLLNFARKTRLNLQEVASLAVVERAFDSVVVPDGVKVSMTCNEPEKRVQLDVDQMIQVFVNLVTNAIEAMSGGGELKIESHVNASSVVYSVTDSGSGIDPDKIKLIFQPFFTTKKLGQGTGLGLAVVYGIVKMHNGTIEVESNSDASKGPTGTTFRVKLPRIHDHAGMGDHFRRSERFI